MNRKTKLLIVFCSGTFLAQCISTEREDPGKRYFAFEANHPGSQKRQKGAGVLRVRRMKISPRFDTRSLVYRTTDVTYKTDFYNEFLSEPQANMTDIVIRWLSGSGIFSSVVDSASSVEETYTMEATVQSLYGDYRSTPQATGSFQVFLIRNNDGTQRVQFQKSYSYSTPIKSKSPEGLVAGYNELMVKFLDDLEKDLSGSVAKENAAQ